MRATRTTSHAPMRYQPAMRMTVAPEFGWQGVGV
jgi:hypothetical protein